MIVKFLNYLKDDNGQTSTEYILLVAVVALIVFKFKSTAVTQLEDLTNAIFEGARTKILDDFR